MDHSKLASDCRKNAIAADRAKCPKAAQGHRARALKHEFLAKLGKLGTLVEQ